MGSRDLRLSFGGPGTDPELVMVDAENEKQVLWNKDDSISSSLNSTLADTKRLNRMRSKDSLAVN